MSKLLSEEQLFDAFKQQMKSSNYRFDRNANGYMWPEARNAFDGFQAAFTLLMPIIEKQMKELEYYSKEENWSYPMGYGMNKTNICIMDTDELHCGGKRARQAIQETKQRLEKLGRDN